MDDGMIVEEDTAAAFFADLQRPRSCASLHSLRTTRSPKRLRLTPALRHLSSLSLDSAPPTVRTPQALGIRLRTCGGVQHSSWRRQQLADLRRAVISDLNKIAAEYVTAFMAHQERGERYEPTDSVFAALYTVDMQVGTLFTPKTHYVYKEWQIMVARHGPARTVHDFVDAQEAALRSMYKEAGFIK